jgi:PAS domain S-box-containing protein
MDADLFRWIVEALEDVVTLHDSTGRLVYVNPAARHLTGFAPEELVGTPAHELAHPEDRAQLEPLLVAEGWKAGEREVEFRCRTRDGTHRWVAARGRRLHDDNGRALGVLCRFRDITRSRTEEERSLRERTLQAVGRLAAGVAHEFNNLLTIITGYACLLLDAHGTGDPDHAALSEIRRAADRAAERVRRLLAVAGQQMLNPTRLDLNDLLRRRADSLQQVLGPGIQLELYLDPATPVLQADPALIEQILQELTANACDAMPLGGRFIVTTAPVAAAPAPAARLTVADTGEGMDESTRAHLFEPCFRTRAAAQASGLGLAVVHGCVRQCGGDITVASQLGRGTTFTLTFPAAPQTDASP